MNKIESVLEKSEELLKEGRFYEYEQKIRTLGTRYYATNKIDEANHLLLSGGLKLLHHKQSPSAMSLIHMMLDTYKNSSKEISKDLRKLILDAFELAPYNKSKLDMMHKVLKHFTPSENDHEIQLLLMKDAYKNKDYPACQKYIITCDDTNDIAIRMLDEWMDEGNPQEREFFAARFILHKLAAKRLEDAKFVLNHYKKAYKTPLMHFLEFLIKAIELKSKKILGILFHEYEKIISKDPTFIFFMKKIGSNYFDYTAPESFGEKMLKFFIQ